MDADPNDLVRWSAEQAELLARRDFSALDVPRLIDEIRAIGDDLRNDALRTLRVLLECGIRLNYGPPGEHRIARKVAITRSERLARHLARAPSLRPWLEGSLASAWQRVRQSEMDDYARHAIVVDGIPLACPWTFAQLLVRDFQPDPGAPI